MKIQIDIPAELNRLLKIEKARKGHKNLGKTIIYILDDYLVKTLKGKDWIFGK